MQRRAPADSGDAPRGQIVFRYLGRCPDRDYARVRPCCLRPRQDTSGAGFPTTTRRPGTILRVKPGRVAVVVALSLLAGACHDGTSDKQTADAALQRGLHAQTSGDTQAAVGDYLDVLSVEPRNKYALYNLGLIAQQRGDAASAETYYRQAIDADPDYEPALFNLAIVRANAGATQEAADLYQRVIQVNPKNAKAYFNLGVLLANAGDQRGGAREVAKAIGLDPSLSKSLPSASSSPSP
jgi:Flp pilus assembly protein TadD